MRFFLSTAMALAGSALAAPPANDAFSNRQNLAGALPVAFVADTIEATAEAEDPTAFLSRPRTVWYGWTPPDAGLYRLDIAPVAGSGSYTLGVVVDGGGAGERRALSKLGHFFSASSTQPIYFSAAAGVPHQFVVGSASPMVFDVSLDATLLPMPGLVDLGGAYPLLVERGAGFSGAPMEWTWTAPEDGLYVLDYIAGFEDTGVRPQFEVFQTNGLWPPPLFENYWAEEPSGSAYHYFRATAGTSYRIRTAIDEVRFVLDRLPDIEHGTFDGALDLGQPATFNVTAHLPQASVEEFGMELPIPPAVIFNAGSHWWRWRAPAAGLYRVTSRGLRMEQPGYWWYPPQPWMFTGDSVQTLQPVATSPSRWGEDFGDADGETTYVFRAEHAGDAFHLSLLNVINGTGPYRPGEWEIEVKPEPEAPNDHFENAFVLLADAPEPTPYVGHFATLEADEPTPSGTGPEPSVYDHPAPVGSLWWTWQAPDATPVELRAGYVTPAGEVRFDIHTGNSLATLQPVVSLAESTNSEHRSFVPTAGQTYRFQLGGVLSTGTIELRSRPDLATRPANDDFANAADIVLPEDSPLTISDASCATATAEVGEPFHLIYPEPLAPQRTRWWRWTADREALVTFRVGWGVALAVYTGSSIDLLDRVAGWGTAHVDSSSTHLTLRSQIGETYSIALADDLISLANAQLTVGFVPVAPLISPNNDQFGARAVLLRTGSVPGVQPFALTHNSATIQVDIDDPAEPTPSLVGARQTTWFRWECDTPDPVAVRMSSPHFGADIYLGDALANLQAVDSDRRDPPDARGYTIFTGTPGTSYTIAVSSVPAGSTCDIEIVNVSTYTLQREAWLQQFPELALADTADRAAPAGDGIPNIVKRALGLSPLIHARSGAEPNAVNLPAVEISPQGVAQLVFTVDPASALSVTSQRSLNGIHWSSGPAPTDLGGNKRAVAIPLGHASYLVRLRVVP